MSQTIAISMFADACLFHARRTHSSVALETAVDQAHFVSMHEVEEEEAAESV